MIFISKTQPLFFWVVKKFRKNRISRLFLFFAFSLLFLDMNAYNTLKTCVKITLFLFEWNIVSVHYVAIVGIIAIGRFLHGQLAHIIDLSLVFFAFAYGRDLKAVTYHAQSYSKLISSIHFDYLNFPDWGYLCPCQANEACLNTL